MHAALEPRRMTEAGTSVLCGSNATKQFSERSVLRDANDI